MRAFMKAWITVLQVLLWNVTKWLMCSSDNGGGGEVCRASECSVACWKGCLYERLNGGEISSSIVLSFVLILSNFVSITIRRLS